MQISEKWYSTVYHPLWNTQILVHKTHVKPRTYFHRGKLLWDSRNPPMKSAADEISS